MQKNYKKLQKGFTLIELLVVIAIIGILATVVLGSLSGARNKANDGKTQAQLSSMRAQAQLFSGTTGTAYIVTTPYAPTGAVAGVATGGTAATGTLFNDSTAANNSLHGLLNTLPSGTLAYYGWDGVSPTAGGKWFVAGQLSTGAFCVDYSGGTKTGTTAVTTTLSTWTTNFANATVAGGYLCN